jgi:hypothetical protein
MAGLVFGKLFFPNEDPLTATLNSFAIYFVLLHKLIGENFEADLTATGCAVMRWVACKFCPIHTDNSLARRRVGLCTVALAHVPIGTELSAQRRGEDASSTDR